ncbi:hypothetical protein AB6A40_011249 [Gnathostoma spinigerum]|uniref:alpha-L-fucosidase n=1 Tax=Gnathostoma spinigerum TaxID=75299 RepID=A0ABD6F4G5_9BILA
MIGQPIVLILVLYLTKSPLSECRKFIKASRNHYEPTWSSLDSRPIPDWYQHAKLGVFCHWGVYSVPAFGSEWFWWDWKGEKIAEYEDYVVRNYKKDISYADFATYFTAEWFDAEVFREIVEASGARYFVFTSKHHEGFTMWPSKTSFNWNSVDIGPHRDIVGMIQLPFL